MEGYFVYVWCCYNTPENATNALSKVNESGFFEDNQLKLNETIVSGHGENGEGDIDCDLRELRGMLAEGCNEGYLDVYSFYRTAYLPETCECGQQKRVFMHNCPKSNNYPEIFGCPICDDKCDACITE